MIDDLFVRWVVTALFAFAAAECVYTVVTGRFSPTRLVSQLLHVVMAVAMIAMAWPAGLALPTTGPMLFFLVATVWFVIIAAAQAGHRGVNLYHGAMMLAMAWMYAVMGGDLSPVPAEGSSQSTHGGPMSMPGMPGMLMPGMDANHTAGPPPFVVGLNALCAGVFGVATVWWLVRVATYRRADPDSSNRHGVGMSAQAMMAAGMAVMFGLMV
ncbi:DUF5134 domain-containing protein [Mycolicibacterium sp. Y3]